MNNLFALERLHFHFGLKRQHLMLRVLQTAQKCQILGIQSPFYEIQSASKMTGSK